MRVPAGLLSLIALAACATSPEPAADPPPAGEPPSRPLPAARIGAWVPSEDGRHRVRVDRVAWTHPRDASEESLGVGLTVELDPERELLAAGVEVLAIAPQPRPAARGGMLRLTIVRDGVTQDMTESSGGPATWLGWGGVENGTGEVWLGGILPAEGTTRFDSVRLGFDLLRVGAWTTHRHADVGASGATGLAAGPFVLDVMSEPAEVWLSARDADAAARGRVGAASIVERIAPRFAADHAEVVDAKGRRLEPWGSSAIPSPPIVCRYRLPAAARGSADPAAAPEPVAYPVTIRVRLPSAAEVERVTFELRDLAFPARSPLLVDL